MSVRTKPMSPSTGLTSPMPRDSSSGPVRVIPDSRHDYGEDR